MANGSLILWRSASMADYVCSLGISDSSKRDARTRNACRSSALRYVLVNDANLKTQAYCAGCGTKIGQCYVRETGSRIVFCDFACYRCALEKLTPRLAGSGANLFAVSQRYGETK